MEAAVVYFSLKRIYQIDCLVHGELVFHEFSDIVRIFQ